MCSYNTDENGKLSCLKQTLDSIFATVDFDSHRLIVINNSPDHKPTVLFLKGLLLERPFRVITPPHNLGTAGGINLGIRERKPGEVVIKCDDDWSTEHQGWADELEKMIVKKPEIGILWLKRDDVYGEMVEDGKILWCHDIFGTCTAYNPAMLDKCGYLAQFSNYGFDDVLISVRSEVAGFKNAFMKDIKIKNLDLVETEYTRWKRREAGVYLGEVGPLCDAYRNGTIDIYDDGGFPV
jgi:glycosyltransferase involved in cell wall biosynthesis